MIDKEKVRDCPSFDSLLNGCNSWAWATLKPGIPPMWMAGVQALGPPSAVSLRGLHHK